MNEQKSGWRGIPEWYRLIVFEGEVVQTTMVLAAS